MKSLCPKKEDGDACAIGASASPAAIPVREAVTMRDPSGLNDGNGRHPRDQGPPWRRPVSGPTGKLAPPGRQRIGGLPARARGESGTSVGSETFAHAGHTTGIARLFGPLMGFFGALLSFFGLGIRPAGPHFSPRRAPRPQARQGSRGKRLRQCLPSRRHFVPLR